MKKLTACLALVGITLTLLYAVEPPPAPKLSKEAHWEAYEAALKKGLPKTAITHLNPIIEKTLADKDHAWQRPSARWRARMGTGCRRSCRCAAHFG